MCLYLALVTNVLSIGIAYCQTEPNIETQEADTTTIDQISDGSPETCLPGECSDIE